MKIKVSMLSMFIFASANTYSASCTQESFDEAAGYHKSIRRQVKDAARIANAECLNQNYYSFRDHDTPEEREYALILKRVKVDSAIESLKELHESLMISQGHHHWSAVQTACAKAGSNKNSQSAWTAYEEVFDFFTLHVNNTDKESIRGTLSYCYDRLAEEKF